MGATSTDSKRPLKIQAGSPVSQQIVIHDAKNVWPTLPDLEVRAQLRTGRSVTSNLITNLHEYMTPAFDGDDLVITWTMTGEQTRELYSRSWGYLKTGFFNVVVSDPGTVDSRAVTVPTIQLKIEDTTTTASGDD